MQNKTPKKTQKAMPKKNIEISPSIAKSEAATSNDKIKKSAPVAKKAVKKDNLVTINFQLTYGTHFGQNIFLSGNIPQLGNGHDENALKLDYIDHLHWGREIKLSKSDIPEEGLQYFYIVVNEDGSLEKSAPYYLYKNELDKDIHLFDAWNYSGYIQNAFTTKVFDVLTKKTKTNSKKSSCKNHAFI
ncbi:MAG: carbohydrate-binding module family 20 domain-containing protein [Arachidicoccus sp.]|nr:carbohydrate-binding module family 20 domain-containing protein [Arachidicoccus sp.]